MRIIAGKHRGRKIESLKGKTVRPTTGRTREAIFNLLMHMPDNPVVDKRALDLCCGTGALGMEALSRGAAHVTFVDQNRDALNLAEMNIQKCGERDHATFHLSDSSAPPKAPEPVSLVMMDAPYHSGLIAPAYTNLVKQGWLKDGTILAFEQDHKEDFPELAGSEIIKQRSYGKTRITLLEYKI